jgi:6-phosphofructokinase 1
MKRIAILTSGGDAPGMNAVIRAAVETAIASGMEVLGVQRGYLGLISGELSPLSDNDVSDIMHTGGSIIESSRCPEFETAEGRSKAVQNMLQAQIDALILIGGDGTFRGGASLIKEANMSVVGVPGTIDNDVYGTDFTIGFDTAVNCAIEAIDRIRDTARTFERVFFVEVMGHHTGYIALQSAVAGGAEGLVIPEVTFDLEGLCRRLKEERQHGKKSAIVVVAEAQKPGYSFQIAQAVGQKTGFESRVCVLGHLQRGGRPTAVDRVLGSKLGTAAVQALMAGRQGEMVGEVKGDIIYTPLADTWEKKKGLNDNLQHIAQILF